MTREEFAQSIIKNGIEIGPAEDNPSAPPMSDTWYRWARELDEHYKPERTTDPNMVIDLLFECYLAGKLL